MRELTLGSLFDGSGGFPLAAALEGIRPVWASEVEPYPIAVTRSRFPNMKHYGDVSKINGAEIEPVDIITFGSPCQDLSVAGKRAGLKHEAIGDEETTRSGLFLEAIRIIREMREATHGVYPTYAIWENVTGAFSSSKGEDFRTVLNEFVNVVEPGAEVPPPPQGRWPYADVLVGDGWSVAYRTFDAQYWGVPQRRRRIYLVADFRGERAGEILFKREGLRGHSAPRTEEREETAADPEDGSGATDSESAGLYEPRSMKEENWTRQAVKGALRAEASKSAHVLIDSIGGQPNAADSENVRGIINLNKGDYQNRRVYAPEGVAPTLGAYTTSWMGPELYVMATQQANAEIAVDKSPTITAAAGMSGNNQPVLIMPTPVATPPYTLKIRQGVERDSAGKKAGKGPLISENLSMTLGVSQDQYLFQPQLYENHSQDSRYTGPHEVAPTTNATYGTGGNNTPLVVYGISAYESNAMKSPNPHSGIYEADTARTIDANGGNPACNQGGMVIVSPEKTGTLMASGYAKNGTQEALNDMYVVQAFAQNQRDEVRNLGTKAGSLAANPGMNQQTYVLQGSMIGRKDENGPQGSGISEDVAFTLNTIDHHAVANGCDFRNGALNEEKYPTLQTKEKGGWSLNFSGGVCLPKDVIPINTMVATRGGADDGRTTFGVGEPGEPQFTLQAAHSHAVAYGIDRAAFNQGKNAQYKPQFDKELSAALIARGPNAVCCWDGDQTADSNCVSEEKMEQRYIVRRLTPTECCRLQGFPDGWGETDAKEDLSDEEFEFWLDARNTHGQINGKAIRHYTKAQMLTWYNKLHTDSAEYKMWGNGIALPCATYVMQGIVDAEKEEEENV